MPPKPINIIRPPKKEIKKFTGVGNNPESSEAIEKRAKETQRIAENMQKEKMKKAAEDAAEKAKKRIPSVLEPEFSLYQQLLAKFTKQEEGQKFQNQVEIPPKGNN